MPGTAHVVSGPTYDGSDSDKDQFVRFTYEFDLRSGVDDFIVVWGGHIAETRIYQYALGGDGGAGDVSGNPYHQFAKTLDVWDTDADASLYNIFNGSADNQLKAAVILIPGYKIGTESKT